MPQDTLLKRVRKIRDRPYQGGTVVYWMSRDQRISDNWALQHAIDLAKQKDVELCIAFCLVPEYLGGTLRQYGFMIRGLHDRFKRIYEAFHLYSRAGRTLLAVLAVSLVVQALRTVVHYEIAKAMGLDIPVIYFFLFVPVIAIFIALPISIGGLGVREGLGIFFFCKAVPGLTSEQAFMMGFLAYVVGVAVSLAGGAIYLARGLAPAQIEREFQSGRLEDGVGRQS